MDRLERDVRQTLRACAEGTSFCAQEEATMLALIREQVAIEFSTAACFQWRGLSMAMVCVLALFFVAAPWVRGFGFRVATEPSWQVSAYMTPQVQVGEAAVPAPTEAMASATPARPGPQAAPKPFAHIEHSGTVVPSLTRSDSI